MPVMMPFVGLAQFFDDERTYLCVCTVTRITMYTDSNIKILLHVVLIHTSHPYDIECGRETLSWQ